MDRQNKSGKEPAGESPSAERPMHIRAPRRATGKPSGASPSNLIEVGQSELDWAAFGKRLRQARKARNWTMAQVASASGISITTVSRVERGQLALGYEKFSALAHALDMDLASMFAEPGVQSPQLKAHIVDRAGQGVVYEGETVRYEFLATRATGKKMTPIAATIAVRELMGPEHFAHHDGEEFVYVLSGKLAVHFQDSAPVELGKGDSIYFDSRVGHAYVNLGRQPARVIGVCSHEPVALAHSEIKSD